MSMPTRSHHGNAHYYRVYLTIGITLLFIMTSHMITAQFGPIVPTNSVVGGSSIPSGATSLDSIGTSIGTIAGDVINQLGGIMNGINNPNNPDANNNNNATTSPPGAVAPSPGGTSTSTTGVGPVFPPFNNAGGDGGTAPNPSNPVPTPPGFPGAPGVGNDNNNNNGGGSGSTITPTPSTTADNIQASVFEFQEQVITPSIVTILMQTTLEQVDWCDIYTLVTANLPTTSTPPSTLRRPIQGVTRGRYIMQSQGHGVYVLPHFPVDITDDRLVFYYQISCHIGSNSSTTASASSSSASSSSSADTTVQSPVRMFTIPQDAVIPAIIRLNTTNFQLSPLNVQGSIIPSRVVVNAALNAGDVNATNTDPSTATTTNSSSTSSSSSAISTIVNTFPLTINSLTQPQVIRDPVNINAINTVQSPSIYDMMLRSLDSETIMSDPVLHGFVNGAHSVSIPFDNIANNQRLYEITSLPVLPGDIFQFYITYQLPVTTQTQQQQQEGQNNQTQQVTSSVYEYTIPRMVISEVPLNTPDANGNTPGLPSAECVQCFTSQCDADVLLSTRQNGTVGNSNTGTGTLTPGQQELETCMSTCCPGDDEANLIAMINSILLVNPDLSNELVNTDGSSTTSPTIPTPTPTTPTTPTAPTAPTTPTTPLVPPGDNGADTGNTGNSGSNNNSLFPSLPPFGNNNNNNNNQQQPPIPGLPDIGLPFNTLNHLGHTVHTYYADNNGGNTQHHHHQYGQLHHQQQQHQQHHHMGTMQFTDLTSLLATPTVGGAIAPATGVVPSSVPTSQPPALTAVPVATGGLPVGTPTAPAVPAAPAAPTAPTAPVAPASPELLPTGGGIPPSPSPPVQGTPLPNPPSPGGDPLSLAPGATPISPPVDGLAAAPAVPPSLPTAGIPSAGVPIPTEVSLPGSIDNVGRAGSDPIIFALNNFAAQNTNANLPALFPNLFSTSNPTPSPLIIPLVSTPLTGSAAIPGNTSPPASAITFSASPHHHRHGNNGRAMVTYQSPDFLTGITDSIGGIGNGMGLGGLIDPVRQTTDHLQGAGHPLNVASEVVQLPGEIKSITCIEAACYARCLQVVQDLFGNAITASEESVLPAPTPPSTTPQPIPPPTGAIAIPQVGGPPPMPQADLLPPPPEFNPPSPPIDPSMMDAETMKMITPVVMDELGKGIGLLTDTADYTNDATACTTSCRTACEAGTTTEIDCTGSKRNSYDCIGKGLDDVIDGFGFADTMLGQVGGMGTVLTDFLDTTTPPMPFSIFSLSPIEHQQQQQQQRRQQQHSMRSMAVMNVPTALTTTAVTTTAATAAGSDTNDGIIYQHQQQSPHSSEQPQHPEQPQQPQQPLQFTSFRSMLDVHPDDPAASAQLIQRIQAIADAGSASMRTIIPAEHARSTYEQEIQAQQQRQQNQETQAMSAVDGQRAFNIFYGAVQGIPSEYRTAPSLYVSDKLVKLSKTRK